MVRSSPHHIRETSQTHVADQARAFFHDERILERLFSLLAASGSQQFTSQILSVIQSLTKYATIPVSLLLFLTHKG